MWRADERFWCRGRRWRRVKGGIVGRVLGGFLSEVLGGFEAPVRAVSDIKPPKLLYKFDPVYPEGAHQIRVEDVVILEATIGIYGLKRNIKDMRSGLLFDQAAIDPVRHWLYEPMIVNGRLWGVIFNRYRYLQVMIALNFLTRPMCSIIVNRT